MTRNKLANRRESMTFDLWHNANRYHISYFADATGIKELFAHGAKVGSDADSALATVTAIISIALQYGVPYDVLEHAALKLEDGNSAELYGAILEAIRLDHSSVNG